MLLGDIGQRQFEVVLGGSACMRSRLGWSLAFVMWASRWRELAYAGDGRGVSHRRVAEAVLGAWEVRGSLSDEK